MGVFSKTSKDALILDRYATRLVVPVSYTHLTLPTIA